MDVLIGSPNLFIISNNEYNHYLTYNDYQNIVLFGMNNANNISFVLEINEDQDITYLFYQLYNYNPLKSEQVYKYILLRPYGKSVDRILEKINLYNYHWRFRINLIPDNINNNINFKDKLCLYSKDQRYYSINFNQGLLNRKIPVYFNKKSTSLIVNT